MNLTTLDTAMGATTIAPDLRSRLRARAPEMIQQLRATAAVHAPDAPAREAGYSIRNAAGDEAIVRIYDEIWFLGVNALDFAADLDEITAPRMRVEINSPGGDVFDGIAIYNALRNHPAHVTTRIDGIAASIASVIAQAGDTRIVQPAAQMMIHNAWGLVVGDTNDHADMADLLDQQDGVIAGIYASHSGRSADEFRALMNAETWLTAEAVLEHGLADEILEPVKNATPAAPAGTLRDEIEAAVDAVDSAIDSASRVVALRAEAGKTLSNRIRDSLVGLQGRLEDIDDVLNAGDDDLNPQPIDDDTARWSADALAQLLARRETVHTRSI